MKMGCVDLMALRPGDELESTLYYLSTWSKTSTAIVVKVLPDHRLLVMENGREQQYAADYWQPAVTRSTFEIRLRALRNILFNKEYIHGSS